MKTLKNKFSLFHYDDRNLELWLEDMAEHGFLLNDYGTYFTSFSKTAPTKVKYKVLIYKEADVMGEEAMIDLYESKGWEFVCRGVRQSYIFRSYDLKADKISEYLHPERDLLSQIGWALMGVRNMLWLIFLASGASILNAAVKNGLYVYQTYGDIVGVTESIIALGLTCVGLVLLCVKVTEIRYIYKYFKKESD